VCNLCLNGTATFSACRAATPLYHKIINKVPLPISFFSECYYSELRDDIITSGYATWFTAGGAIPIVHYDVIDDVINRKLQQIEKNGDHLPHAIL